MSQLIKAMDSLKVIFDKYAKGEGDKNSLTKNELSNLLRSEMPGMPEDNASVNRYFQSLDADGDGVVSFQEYVSFVAALTVIINE